MFARKYYRANCLVNEYLRWRSTLEASLEKYPHWKNIPSVHLPEAVSLLNPIQWRFPITSLKNHTFWRFLVCAWKFRMRSFRCRQVFADYSMKCINFLQYPSHPDELNKKLQTFPHNTSSQSHPGLFVDGCPVHLWNAFGLSMPSFCHAQHSSPRHWPSTTTVNDNGAVGNSN